MKLPLCIICIPSHFVTSSCISMVLSSLYIFYICLPFVAEVTKDGMFCVGEMECMVSVSFYSCVILNSILLKGENSFMDAPTRHFLIFLFKTWNISTNTSSSSNLCKCQNYPFTFLACVEFELCYKGDKGMYNIFYISGLYIGVFQNFFYLNQLHFFYIFFFSVFFGVNSTGVLCECPHDYSCWLFQGFWRLHLQLLRKNSFLDFLSYYFFF